jgi:hypothetical protein
MTMDDMMRPQGMEAMTPQRMERPNGGMPGLDTAVDQGVKRLTDVVDQAVLRIADERERGLVREGVTTVVREILQELAEDQARRQMVHANGNGAMAIGDAAQAGMNVAKQVQNLGFVEFTAGLITGTFDAIIGATLKQMDAYAKLVADLAKTLAQFQAENISDAQVNAHLAERYPDGQGGTVVRAGFTFTDTAADPANGVNAKAGREKLQEVVGALIAQTANLRAPAVPLTRDTLGIAEDANVTQFTAAQVTMIRTAIGQSLATSMMEHLRAMAREGMARIVITNGEIQTKLTFSVTATEQDTRRSSNFHRDSAGAYVRGSAWAPWGRASAGASWNQVNVRTVNESSFDSLTMSTEIIGQVKINFKTETFPPITTEQS